LDNAKKEKNGLIAINLGKMEKEELISIIKDEELYDPKELIVVGIVEQGDHLKTLPKKDITTEDDQVYLKGLEIYKKDPNDPNMGEQLLGFDLDSSGVLTKILIPVYVNIMGDLYEKTINRAIEKGTKVRINNKSLYVNGLFTGVVMTDLSVSPITE